MSQSFTDSIDFNEQNMIIWSCYFN